MKLIEYYFHLFIVFSKGSAFQEAKLTRNEISKELQCSERTVTNILNRMVDKKWIKREKGEGRGNVTTITFMKTMEEMFDCFESKSPNFDEMLRLIALIENSILYKEKEQVLSGMISKLFGLKVDSKSMEQEEENEYEHLKIPYFRSFHSLDPSAVERQSERHMVEQIFNTLVTYNKKRKKIEPSISHYWEEDNNGKEWTFYLRKGINFHHNKMLTSKDVKFSFERLRHTPSKWLVRNLKSINCIGKHVIQFEFSQSMYCLDILLASQKFSIVPDNYGGKSEKEFAKSPIGTGPYMVRQHDNNLLNLMVHPLYFQGRAFIDEISIYVLPTIEKYFNANQMEHEPLFYIPFSIDKDNDGEYNFIQHNHLSVKYLMWNMDKKKIKRNGFLRRRIATILNKDKMVKDLGYPRFQKANSFIEYDYAHAPQHSVNNQGNNYDESLTLMTYELPPNEDDIKWIQTEMAKHNINLQIITVPYSSFIERAKEADLVLSEFVSEHSREVSLYNLFQSGNSVFSKLYHSDETICKLIDKAMSEKQQETRIQLLKQLEAKLFSQDIIIPLYSTYQKALFHKNLMGISLSTIGLVLFDRLFFRKK